MPRSILCMFFKICPTEYWMVSLKQHTKYFIFWCKTLFFHPVHFKHNIQRLSWETQQKKITWSCWLYLYGTRWCNMLPSMWWCWDDSAFSNYHSLFLQVFYREKWIKHWDESREFQLIWLRTLSLNPDKISLLNWRLTEELRVDVTCISHSIAIDAVRFSNGSSPEVLLIVWSNCSLYTC